MEIDVIRKKPKFEPIQVVIVIKSKSELNELVSELGKCRGNTYDLYKNLQKIQREVE